MYIFEYVLYVDTSLLFPKIKLVRFVYLLFDKYVDIPSLFVHVDQCLIIDPPEV
jgi:hypothetical protein